MVLVQRSIVMMYGYCTSKQANYQADIMLGKYERVSAGTVSNVGLCKHLHILAGFFERATTQYLYVLVLVQAHFSDH